MIARLRVCILKTYYLHFICQLGTSGHTFSAKNSTKDECNQDGIGIRSVVHYYFNNRNRQCYKQFFVGGKPPDGLRKLKDKDIQYICQPPRPNQLHQNPPDTYYATMFDKRYGIAVFSAYTLTKEKAVFKNYNGQLGWCPTPGNLLTCTQKGNAPVIKVSTCMMVGVVLLKP